MTTLVLACGHCNVPESVSSLSLDVPDRLVWDANLCGRSERILRQSIAPDTNVVFLVGPDLDQQVTLAEDAVGAGIHPLRIRFLDAWRLSPDRDSLVTHLRAVIAGMRTRGSVELMPSRSTNRFRGHLPRRSVVLPHRRYRAPLPRVDSSRCRAASGCDLCIRACPAQAIAKGTPPHVDPATCTSCGLCLAACPVGAIGHPSMDFRTFEAEAEQLAASPHRNLLVVCTPVLTGLTPKVLPSDSAMWRILEVPSLGALRPEKVLRLLAKGFDRVIGLAQRDCCPGTPGPFAVVAAFLEGFGYAGCVAHWDLQEGPVPSAWSLPPPRAVPPFGDLDSLAQAATMIPDAGVDLVPLPGPGAGVIEIDADRCTFCGLCAERCGSEALAIEESPSDELVLRFDHGRCDGCGLCIGICPERALTLRTAVDKRVIGRPVVLKEDVWVICRSCGARVAPRSMVAQVTARTKVSVDIDLCPDCKPRQLLAGFPSKR